MQAFALHPRLASDCRIIGDLPLCQLLMMNDARFPWFVLVPRVDGARDPIDLQADDYARLWEESAVVCRALRAAFSPHKLNVASLGNLVPQLHVHHIARYESDAAWPGPVWGVGSSEAMAAAAQEAQKNALLGHLPAGWLA